MGKTLGIALIIGGTLVGIIIIWLGNIYLQQGDLDSRTVVISTAFGIILLVLPQISFGIYLWLRERQYTE